MAQRTSTSSSSPLKRKHAITLLLAVVALCIGVFGTMLYRHEKREITQKIADQLMTITSIKSDHLAEWYADERLDVDLIAGNGVLVEILQNWLSTGSIKDHDLLARYISSLKREHGYEDLFVYSPDQERYIFPSTGYDLPNPALQRLADSTADLQRVFTTGVYHFDEHESPHIDFIAPIRMSHLGNRFVLVARFDPRIALFPLVENWPSAAIGAETYIVRKDEDSLVILSNLRHTAAPALTFGVPLGDTTLAVIRGVRQPHIIVEGIDFQDQRVFSHAKPVQGTPWHIVAELERSKAMSGFNFEVRALAGLIVLLLAVLATGYALFYSNRQREMLKRLSSLQQEYHTILLGIPDAVITTDADGLIRHLNPAAEALTEWKEDDACGKPFDVLGGFVKESDGATIANPVVRLLSPHEEHGPVDELLFLNGSGKRIPIQERASIIRSKSGGVSGAVILLREQAGLRARQRQIEENEIKFRGLFEATSDAIAVYDLVPHENDEEFSAVLTDCNERFAALLQKPTSALIGTKIEDVSVVEGDTLLEALRKAKAINAPLVSDLHAKDLGKYFVLTAFTPAPHRAAIAFHDVTEIKRAEEELNEKLRELERFNRLTVDRELRMIELKSEVNSLLSILGEQARYGSVQ